MKPKLLTIFALCFNLFVFAQPGAQKKPKILVYNISFSDYTLPQLMKDSGSSNALKQGSWYKPASKSLGIGLSMWKGLTPHIDFSGSLHGTFSNFPSLFVKNDSIGQASFSPQLDALLHFKALKEQATVNPFLTAGVGAGYFGKMLGIYAPLGAGLQFHFKQGAYLLLQAQWRKRLSGGINNDYLFYNIGFAQHMPRIKKQQETFTISPPTLPLAPADQDGDGIADKDDQCPDEKGSINGCPDSDDDGITDKDDLCPDVRGSFNGCPDSDGDDIADNEDKCKDMAGVARYDGCPVPDKDGDGVNDEEDRCPDEKGITEQIGCPEIQQEIKKHVEYAAKNIFFQYASDKILKKSHDPLNVVAKLLQEHPELKLDIGAHTDSIGSAEGNMQLGERRAKAVADYFVSKGIDAARISFRSYGATMPVASNKTAEGRARNRRVEMKLGY